MGKTFWPGFRWRILAHERTKIGKANLAVHTGEIYDRRSGEGYTPMTDGPTPVKYLGGTGIWEFDELCIDHWFHLEQMGDRYWWIGVGDPDNGDYYHINVHIDGKRQVSVNIENQK